METNLNSYITEARARKISDDTIKEALIKSGWPEDKVSQAFIQPGLGDDLMPPPPPPPVQHVGMWIGFLYIIFFISLYVLATAIGGLLHDWIDAVEPIKIKNDYSISGNNGLIRGFVAAVIVSFPIFLTLAFVLKKQLMQNPVVSNLRSRKILIYLTLIGTFLIMISHVIFIIYDFLGGTFTATASKHLLVTFLIAGGIFWYFISEVKHDRKTT